MSYALWKAERKSPTPEERRADRPTEPGECLGYWRKIGARTRPDTPIAIWQAEGKSGVIFQFGAGHPFNSEEEGAAERLADFFAKDWLKCVAVTREEWSAALDTGKWPDNGKPIRLPTVEEKADVIPPTSAAEGGNAPESDALWEQIKAKLDSAAEKLKQIGAITTLEKANAAAEVVEEMRAAGKIGETQRKAEKQPHDDAAAAVQAKWVPVLQPASEAVKHTVEAIQRFKDAEQRRLKEEARKREEAERQRLAEEAAAKLRAEAEERARQAEQMGMEVERESEEELSAQAAAIAAEQIEQMPQADTSVRVGTAHGRAISKPKISKGRIVDVLAFFEAIKDHDLTRQFLQQRADALARAGATVPGVEFYKE